MSNVRELKNKEDCDSQCYISGCTCTSGISISGSVCIAQFIVCLIFPVLSILPVVLFPVPFQHTVRVSCGRTGDSVGASDPRSSVRDP